MRFYFPENLNFGRRSTSLYSARISSLYMGMKSRLNRRSRICTGAESVRLASSAETKTFVSMTTYAFITLTPVQV